MESKRSKIGAVVVLYKPEKRDFKNLLDYVGKVDITIIADNSPQSNLSKFDAQCQPNGEQILYRHYPENIGLAKALNLSIRELADKLCEWVLVMDQDSHFMSDILQTYWTYIKNHDCRQTAVLGPIYQYDRRKMQPYSGTKSVKRIMTSGNFINTAIFGCLDGYMEELFVDGIDFEYCLRARQHGYDIMECGQAILAHQPAKTKTAEIFGKTLLKYGYAFPERYCSSARASVFLWKEYRDIYSLLFHIYHFLKILLLFDNKREYMRQFWQGTKEGLSLAKANGRIKSSLSRNLVTF